MVGSMIKKNFTRKKKRSLLNLDFFLSVNCEAKKRLEEKDGLRLPPSLNLDKRHIGCGVCVIGHAGNFPLVPGKS